MFYLPFSVGDVLFTLSPWSNMNDQWSNTNTCRWSNFVGTLHRCCYYLCFVLIYPNFVSPLYWYVAVCTVTQGDGRYGNKPRCCGAQRFVAVDPMANDPLSASWESEEKSPNGWGKASDFRRKGLAEWIPNQNPDWIKIPQCPADRTSAFSDSFFRSAVLKVSEGVSPGATKGWYCMCQTVSAEVLCGSVLSAFECPDGRAQGLYGSWSQAIDFWHWTSCTGLPINEVTRTSAMRAMCCNSQWLRASLLLADLPVSGISSPAVSSLCAMILTELEHEAHLDASHMSLISRMSRSCELYLGHSIKSPADLE